MRTTSAFAFLILPTMVGAQWTYAASPTTVELRGLSMMNGRVAWTSGTHGTVLRSTDGGRTWAADTVPGATLLDFRAIHAFNDGSAEVASAGEAEKGLAKIYATGDGGRHWNLVYSTEQKGVFLDAIAFWDLKNGIALSDPVDGRFFILTSTDRGETWNRLAPETLPQVLPGEAAFAASGSSLVVLPGGHVWIGTGGGGRGRVMHSPDFGKTWTVADTPVHAQGPASGIFSLAFRDPAYGIAVGGDYTKPRLASQSVAVTRDGGRTWTAAKEPPSAYLSGVAFAGNARRVVAVGLTGTFVSRDSGQTWTQTDTVAMNSVRFSGRAGIAVGPRGRIAWSDGIR